MARTTLAHATDAEAVLARLGRISPDAPRRWGTMTPNEMVCHLADAFGTALGEVRTKPVSIAGVPAWLAKWMALSVPLPWPRGVRGPAEIDPKRRGTKPAAFEADRDRAITMAHRLIAEASTTHRHPLFGPMSREDWLQWGWLHLDHHLRQFGG